MGSVWDWFNRIGTIGIALGGIVTIWQVIRYLAKIAANTHLLIQHAPSIEAVSRLAPLVTVLAREFRENGGSSLRDKVGVIERQVQEHSGVLERQNEVLEAQNKTLAEIKQEVHDGFAKLPCGGGKCEGE